MSLLLPAVLSFGQTRVQYDFGDAPDQYPTVLAANGAQHTIVQGFLMGKLIDAEGNGQPSAGADKDDLTTSDDEDGVVFTSDWYIGQTATFNLEAQIPARTANYLNVWVDFNGDGDWADAGEQILVDKTLVNGINAFTITVPTGLKPLTTYARFRLSSVRGLSFAGAAPDGEVEDYVVKFGEPRQQLDFGDAPQQYPTLLAANGARHTIVQGFQLGKLNDAEPDGQTSAGADRDDIVTSDDEDGVAFISSWFIGQTATFDVNAQVPTTRLNFLNVWVDYNMDGDWADLGEQVILNKPLLNGSNPLSVVVPGTIKPGMTYARFRLSSVRGLSFDSPAEDGEVEDYPIEIKVLDQRLDFGDARDVYPTMLAVNGARHTIVQGFQLGKLNDPELDGQPSGGADRDDLTTSDDEDGVVFSSDWYIGQPANFNVEAQVLAATANYLNVWVDFNGDGDWADAGEQIIVDKPLVNGSNPFTITVPTGLKPLTTYARFRLSSTRGLGFVGAAPDGEVEDYLVKLIEPRQQLDFGDAPDQYPTVLTANGARHTIVQGFQLGKLNDPEPDGQPSGGADRDDLTTSDDEDGVVFTSDWYIGQPANFNVEAQVLAATANYLNVWVDFNGDGDWADAGEQIIVDKPLVNGSNPFTITVPTGLKPLTTYARFRLSSTRGLGFVGAAPDGEVEDYLVKLIEPRQQLDFGDAPDQYPTVLTANGARHTIIQGFQLGKLNDPELDGQPSGGADRDDIVTSDDEDGVTFTSAWIIGQTATFNVEAQVPVATGNYLNVWVDYNLDGDWADAGEQVIVNKSLVNGANPLSVLVPSTIKPMTTYIRFRLSSIRGLSFDGFAENGEVEDYPIEIKMPEPDQRLDFGDAPDQYPTVLTANGARHTIVEGFMLGKLIDSESDGQPSGGADRDDLIVSDDEDGVTFQTLPLMIGQIAKVRVEASQQGMLDAWVDFGGNGRWSDPGDQIFKSQPLNAGLNDLTFNVPATIKPLEVTYARFRLSRNGGLADTNACPDGEVEDYKVSIIESPPPSGCIEFEGSALGSTYNVGATLTDSGVSMLVETFQWGNGTWTAGGHVRVTNAGMAGHSGQDLNINNANLRFRISDCWDGLSLLYGEYGGNLNIEINGVFKNFENMLDIDGLTLGGVLIKVIDLGGSKGRLELSGRIMSFSLGGQELWIDHVCPELCQTTLEIDPFPMSLAHLVLELPNGNLETITLSGPATAAVNIDDKGTASDTDGDGRDQVRATLTRLSLSGRSSAGLVRLMLAANQPAGGEIEELVNQTAGLLDVPPFSQEGQAESFFDVFLQVEVNGVVLRASQPMRLQAVITHKPPREDSIYENAQSIPIDLLDGTGKSTGYRLVRVSHQPNPPLEIDTFTDVSVQLRLIGPNSLGEIVTLAGTATIHVVIPEDGTAADTDGNNLDQAPAQIVQLELRGTSSLGELRMKQMPDRASRGQIEERSNNFPGILDLPPFVMAGQADCVFDIWFTVEAAGQTFTGIQPLQLRALISHKPPAPGEILSNPNAPSIALINSAGQLTGQTIGQVELKLVSTPPLDFGDAPDPGYPTLLAHNGARHRISNLFLGARIDTEPDGQPSPGATRDDLAVVPDDEDGVQFLNPLIQGTTVNVRVVSSMSARLDAWIDFSKNGVWEGPEQIFISQPVPAGAVILPFTVPRAAVPGDTYARFRLSSAGGLSPVGLANDGEVEDYRVLIRPRALLAQINLTSANNRPALQWEGPGIVESAPNVLGPWTPILASSSPFPIAAAKGTAFYRVRTSVGPVDFAWMLKRSDLVFEGTVAKVEYRNSISNRTHDVIFPHTFVTLEISDVLKGKVNANTYCLRLAGGLAPDGTFIRSSRSALFDVGEQVILFVRRPGQIANPLVDGREGRFRIVQGEVFTDEGREVLWTENARIAYGDRRQLAEAFEHQAGNELLKLIHFDPSVSQLGPQPEPPDSPVVPEFSGGQIMTSSQFKSFLRELIPLIHTSEELQQETPAFNADPGQPFSVEEPQLKRMPSPIFDGQ